MEYLTTYINHKQSTIKLFGHKYDPYEPYERKSGFTLNDTSYLHETLCKGQYGSILPFLTTVDVFGSTCTQLLMVVIFCGSDCFGNF